MPILLGVLFGQYEDSFFKEGGIMFITLSNNQQIQIKNINLIANTVDYRRINDPIYSGDCLLYLAIIDFSTALNDIKLSIENEISL